MAQSKNQSKDNSKEKSESKSKAPAAKAAAPKAVAPKEAAKKTEAKKSPSSSGGSPLIDTSMVASNAARMLTAGISAKSSGQKPSAKPESAMFKQMKSGLNKPHGATMDNLLDKTHGPSSGKSAHGFDKQVGQNQTIGSDAARTNVPRRTNG